MLEVWRMEEVKKVTANAKDLQTAADAQALARCTGGCHWWDSQAKKLWVNLPNQAKTTVTVEGSVRTDNKN